MNLIIILCHSFVKLILIPRPRFLKVETRTKKFPSECKLPNSKKIGEIFPEEVRILTPLPPHNKICRIFWKLVAKKTTHNVKTFKV